MTAEEALTTLDTVLNQKRLNNVEELVFRESWSGRSYAEIAASSGYDTDYIKHVGLRLWRSLSKVFGEKVTKSNIQSALRRYKDKVDNSCGVGVSPALRPIGTGGTPIPPEQLDKTPIPPQQLDKTPIPPQQLDKTPIPEEKLDKTPIPPQQLDKTPIPPEQLDKTPIPPQQLDKTLIPPQQFDKTPIPPQQFDRNLQYSHPRQDWGDAIDVSVFYGRNAELIELEQWIVQKRCRLVAILGMGGMGKTALSIKLAERIQEHFEFVVWRSLHNAPPIEDFLTDLIQFFSDRQETNLPDSIDGKISRLLKYFRSSRCLLILDNLETILKCGEQAGHYRSEYEDYGYWLKCIGETRHQSCLVLTSREKPIDLTFSEGKALPIRSFHLSGLPVAEGKKIFQAKADFCGEEAEWKAVIEHYAGNPLILKRVATINQCLFDGSISKFTEDLGQESLVIDDVRFFLDSQFYRLSSLEEELMYWLAINREPVCAIALQSDVIPKVSLGKLLESLASLQRRFLIEKTSGGYTQQPFIMEYITENLIEQITREIENSAPIH